uniref:WRKY19-like zinc finger domain-containing protein n=1 Tax=Mucochytrium quahogii TaxID=96639 RepID=A0A7S2WFC7_9STRA|mmetsp:Transcript_22242/g.48364  ORF Transcript_22242/g.48364 Transcript_22242/m.48364 type:complete len:421 (+) Transcript_22242:67-1329(+)
MRRVGECKDGTDETDASPDWKSKFKKIFKSMEEGVRSGVQGSSALGGPSLEEIQAQLKQLQAQSGITDERLMSIANIAGVALTSTRVSGIGDESAKRSRDVNNVEGYGSSGECELADEEKTWKRARTTRGREPPRQRLTGPVKTRKGKRGDDFSVNSIPVNKIVTKNNSDVQQLELGEPGVHRIPLPPKDDLLMVGDVKANNRLRLGKRVKRECEIIGCDRIRRGKTPFCKKHGGGPRCMKDGCDTAAVSGRSGLCQLHGGGRRCGVDGCDKAARSPSTVCIGHGGGRRCIEKGCTNSQQRPSEYCLSHGGGRLCSEEGCEKGAKGNTMKCIGHGGGLRCVVAGCPKSARGKTNRCQAHGGGRKCEHEGCTKASASGPVSLCVAHGGGRRCSIEGCKKSAQGAKLLCKAHGGGSGARRAS